MLCNIIKKAFPVLAAAVLLLAACDVFTDVDLQPGGGPTPSPVTDASPTPVFTAAPTSVPTGPPASPPVTTPTPPPYSFEEYDIPTEDAGTMSLDVAADGTVWFTEFDGSKIGHFLPASETFTEYTTTLPPRDIKYNSVDGLVYFTLDSYGDGAYGVLNSNTFNIDLYLSGLPVASTVDCYIDEIGSFWFNGWDSQSLCKADSAGNVINYTLPEFGYTSGLTRDEDDNMWLTMVGSSESNPRLVRMNSSFQFTIINLLTSPLTIREPIAAYGKIWYVASEYNGGYTANSSIGCYDPVLGGFNSYLVPTENSGVSRLTADGTGLLWFSEWNGNKLGVLNAATGGFVEYSLPTEACGITDLAVDNERNVLWYLAMDANKLGRFMIR